MPRGRGDRNFRVCSCGSSLHNLGCVNLKVLLINSNLKNDILAAPPIGLCYVAMATEAAGHVVKVLDLCFLANNIETELEKSIDSFRPEVVGVSVRNIDNVNMLHSVSYLPEVVDLVAQIRALTSVPVVLGGSGASLIPESVLRTVGADYIVVSDGEESFSSLLKHLETNSSPVNVPGVGFIRDGVFHITPPKLSVFNSSSPDIGRWVDMTPYQNIGSAYNIQTKRGCRKSCIYCTYNQSLEGNRLRLRPPVEVVDELEEAYFKYRPQTFEFVDSVFNDPVEYSKSILEEIIRRPWKADFTAMGVHPRGLDDEYLKLMWKAGFRSFMITPESVSDEMLKNYRKGFVKEDVIKAAEAINRTSFSAWWFFMIGGPGETNETVQESLDFAMTYLQKKGRPVTHVAHFFFGVRIYPDTRLWEIAVQEGFINDQTDPGKPLWYVSDRLNLEKAVDQMFSVASKCPEIYLGFDERMLSFSKAIATFCRIFHRPRPYWKYMRFGNVIGITTGLRFIFKPNDAAGFVRETIKRQRHRGDLTNREN